MLKLKEVTDPRFEIELPDGTVKSLDPFEITEKLELLAREALNASKDEQGNVTPLTQAQLTDIKRQALGFPTQAEVDAAPDPKPYTLSRHGAVWLETALGEFIEGLEVSKKASKLMRRSSTGTEAQ